MSDHTPHLPDAIELLATDTLVPYARNSRTHSPEQITALTRSMAQFGFTNPVLIDGQNTIIAGHGRVMAAQALGLPAVPCIRLTHLSDAQRRAYVIADNKLAEQAGWDMATLARELEDLADDGFDIDLLGFGDDELATLLDDHGADAGQGGGLTDPDAVPAAPVVPITVLGDVWLMGKHRVMCGDSTNIDAVAKLMDGQKAQLLHADPPYGMGKENEGVENDNLYGAKLDAFQMDWWRVFRAWMENNACAYVWGNAPDLWRLWYVGGLSASERLTIRNQIIWNKKSVKSMKTVALRMFPTATEHCLFFMLGEQGFNNNADNYWDGWDPIRDYIAQEMKRCGWTVADLDRITGTKMGGHWANKSQWVMITANHYQKIQKAARDNDAFKRDYDAFKRDYDDLKRDYDDLKRDYDDLKRDFYATRAYFDNTHDCMTDVWEFPRVTGDERHGHTTPKPLEMMARVMKSSLPPGGLCTEPFGGSGSTLMAAERTGRTCFTMELQPRYTDVIVTRWQDFTGQQATLEATGQTFAQVKHQRQAVAA